jgi:hypothetical protein
LGYEPQKTPIQNLATLSLAHASVRPRAIYLDLCKDRIGLGFRVEFPIKRRRAGYLMSGGRRRGSRLLVRMENVLVVFRLHGRMARASAV